MKGDVKDLEVCRQNGILHLMVNGTGKVIHQAMKLLHIFMQYLYFTICSIHGTSGPYALHLKHFAYLVAVPGAVRVYSVYLSETGKKRDARLLGAVPGARETEVLINDNIRKPLGITVKDAFGYIHEY